MEAQLNDLRHTCEERAISNEHRLTNIDDKVTQLLALVQDDVMHKIREHDERLDALEHSRIWFGGWAAGAGAVGAAVATLIGRIL